MTTKPVGERDEAQTEIGRCILKLPAGERGGVEGGLNLGKGISRLRDRAEAAEADNAKLRQIISECAAALPNGAGIAPTASLDFMKMLPGEIASVCANLTTGATK